MADERCDSDEAIVEEIIAGEAIADVAIEDAVYEADGAIYGSEDGKGDGTNDADEAIALTGADEAIADETCGPDEVIADGAIVVAAYEADDAPADTAYG